MIHDSSKHWSDDVRKAAEELDNRFPRREWTSTYPGHGENSPVGAYAVDFMCNKADGDRIAAYVWKHRKRLGVRYVIWNKRIISETSNTPNRWVWYFGANSSNPSVAHTNHVHVSFYPHAKYRPVAKRVTMWATRPIKGYAPDGSGRVKYHRKQGWRVIGKVVSRSDGKYIQTRFGTLYPMDSLTSEKPAS